jgi:hypothetical protein
VVDASPSALATDGIEHEGVRVTGNSTKKVWISNWTDGAWPIVSLRNNHLRL